MDSGTLPRTDGPESVVCRIILAVALIGFGLAAIRMSFWNPWLSQSDPSAHASLARSLLEGRGYTADYLWVYFHRYASISHPEDTWPPLMPLMMAGSFLLFGVSAGAARIPTILCWLALAWMVYVFSSRHRGMGPLAGLIGAFMVLMHLPFLRASVRFPFNDVCFAAFFFPGLWFVYRSRVEEVPGRYTFLGVLFTALCIYLKFQGALLVMVYIAWNFQRDKWRRWLLKSAVFLALLLLSGTPLLVRNMRAFGTPLFPNVHSMNAITSTWGTPSKWWNNRRLLGRIWYDNPMTYRRAIKEHGATSILLIKPLQRLKAMASGMCRGNIISWWAIFGLLQGLVVVMLRGRRFAVYLLIVVILSTTVVIFGHYEGRYFLFLHPWGAVVAAWGYTAIIGWFGARTRRWVAYIVAAALIIGAAWSPFKEFAAQYRSLKQADRPFAYERMVEWICNSTPPGSAFMAFSSFEPAFECGRPTAWVPNEPYARVEALMKGYGVKYLLLENPGLHKRFLRSNKRRDIHWRWMGPLWHGREALGFKKLFEIEGKYIIYRVPWANGA